MMTDFPVMSAPRALLSGHPGGQWKIPDSTPPGNQGEDNHGDGQMIIDLVHGLYRMVYRSGGEVNGCVYLEKPYDGDPFNWTGVLVPGNAEGGAIFNNINPHKAFQSTHATNAGNIDTAGILVNPLTGVAIVLNGVKPGNLHELLAGEFEIGNWGTEQFRTSKPPHKGAQFLGFNTGWNNFAGRHEAFIDGTVTGENTWTGEAWHKPRQVSPTSYPPPGLRNWQGGSIEGTAFHDPFNSEFVLVTEVKSTGAAEWGTVWKNRLQKYTSPEANFDTLPVWTAQPALGPGSWIWDVEDDPGYLPDSESGEPSVIWGTEPGLTPRAGIAINPYDGSWHMVAIQRTPNLLALPNRESSGIGHWYSHDEGATWTQDSRNPLFNWATHGYDSEIGTANKFNSPYIMFDTDKNAGSIYVGYWSGPDMNQKGTRFYLSHGVLNEFNATGFTPRLSFDADEEFDLTIGATTKLWEATQHGVRRKRRTPTRRA